MYVFVFIIRMIAKAVSGSSSMPGKKSYIDKKIPLFLNFDNYCFLLNIIMLIFVIFNLITLVFITILHFNGSHLSK